MVQAKFFCMASSAQSFVNSFLELQTDEAVTREEGCLLNISTTLSEKTD